METPRQILIISHTHWDREWYRPYQQFRLRLVDVLDQLLDLMAERPDFLHFTLDGQSIILEDYLSLRPERAEEVRDLVQSGRLHVGPWYVQPDEFLVSGESLIRNLLLGERIAGPWGGVARIGWLPDTFGHVAQLPQLLCNFGIDNFVFTRGLGDQLAEPRTEFWWEAPNGDRVLALHQVGGYWNAANLGYPYFWGDASRRPADPDLALAQVKELVAELGPKGSVRVVALWNGADHMPPQATLPDLIAYLNQNLAGWVVRHARVEDYVQAIHQAQPQLPVIRGELRGSRYQAVLPTTSSSRMYVKQANHMAQRLLERQAEPLAAMAWLLGRPYPRAQLREAWRLLLQNHPHDSICGCSIDQVHREMMARFGQVQQIGEWIVEKSLHTWLDHVDTSWCRPGSTPLVVFNPLGQPRHEVVVATLRWPWRAECCRAVSYQGQISDAQLLSRKEEGYDWLPSGVSQTEFLAKLAWWAECLRELDGLAIKSYAWEAKDGGVALHLHLGDWQLADDCVIEQLQAEAAAWPPAAQVAIWATFHEIRLAFVATVPACGYAVYAIESGPPPPQTPGPVWSGHGRLENEHLRVELAPDGCLSVTHKASGWRADGLHRFEDSADAGDTYDFCLPSGDVPILASDTPQVELIEQGPLQTTLRVRHTLRVPESLTDDRTRRAPSQVELPITTRLRLSAGCPYLEILTIVENRARDHRLRVLFPTGPTSERVYADGHFAIASRPALPGPGEGWCQPPSTSQPHHSWFAADDGHYGLAILSQGLPEHEASPGQDGLMLALTLLRGVGWLSRGDLPNRSGQAGLPIPTPDAQCPGVHQFRYALLPYQHDPLTAGLPHLASAFDTPLLARPAQAKAGKWPPSMSFLSLEPESLQLTALKCSESGNRLVLRFYNIATQTVTGHIRFGLPVAQAWRATAGERVTGKLDISPDGKHCQLEVAAAEIVTLVCRLDQEMG